MRQCMLSARCVHLANCAGSIWTAIVDLLLIITEHLADIKANGYIDAVCRAEDLIIACSCQRAADEETCSPPAPTSSNWPASPSSASLLSITALSTHICVSVEVPAEFRVSMCVSAASYRRSLFYILRCRSIFGITPNVRLAFFLIHTHIVHFHVRREGQRRQINLRCKLSLSAGTEDCLGLRSGTLRICQG